MNDNDVKFPGEYLIETEILRQVRLSLDHGDPLAEMFDAEIADREKDKDE